MNRPAFNPGEVILVLPRRGAVAVESLRTGEIQAACFALVCVLSCTMAWRGGDKAFVNSRTCLGGINHNRWRTGSSFKDLFVKPTDECATRLFYRHCVHVYNTPPGRSSFSHPLFFFPSLFPSRSPSVSASLSHARAHTHTRSFSPPVRAHTHTQHAHTYTKPWMVARAHFCACVCRFVRACVREHAHTRSAIRYYFCRTGMVSPAGCQQQQEGNVTQPWTLRVGLWLALCLSTSRFRVSRRLW